MKYSAQRLSSLVFTFAISIHFLILYGNTSSANIEWLEVLKVFGALFTLGISSSFSNTTKLQIIKYSFYALSMHIFIAIFEALVGGANYFIAKDGRFIAKLLGRGAGETAWAFCVFLVTLNFLRELRCINIALRVQQVISLCAILIIFMTQTRSAILFLVIYYIGRFISKTGNKIDDMIKVLVVILIVGIVTFVLNPALYQVIDRSLSIETIFTGREYIWAAKMTAFAEQDIVNSLFGSDLSSKIHEVPEINYLTADPHNLYIDIFQYYGLLGVAYTVLWYKFAARRRLTTATPILVAFIVMSMFVSTFRYSMVFYANIILLLVVIVRPSLNTWKMK